METMQIQPMGKIRRRGNRYCGAQCGRGCLHVEFESAKKSAEGLRQVMGAGWTARVWENLGWHYEVFMDVANIHVNRGRGGGFTYTVYFNTNPQFIATARSPHHALHLAVAQANEKAHELRRAVAIFGADGDA